MTIKQLKSKGGLWRATIDFDNSYARKGTNELFATRHEAESWKKAIKRQFGKKGGKK